MPGLFKSKNKTEQESTFSSKTTPIEQPRFDNYSDLLLNLSSKNLNEGLPAGFEERGILGINSTFDALDRGASENLGRRGLLGSPIAGASEIDREIGRFGEIGKFRSTLPEIERQARLQNFAQAMQLYSLRPRGQAQEGESSATSETTFTPSMFDSITSIASFAAGLGIPGGLGDLLKGGGQPRVNQPG